MENSTHSFREMNQFLKELWIKSKTVIMWRLRNKKGHIIFPKERF